MKACSDCKHSIPCVGSDRVICNNRSSFYYGLDFRKSRYICDRFVEIKLRGVNNVRSKG